MAEQRLRELANVLAPKMPDGWGFSLIVFTLGDKGWLSYISNVEREDCIKALGDLLDRWKRNEPSD